MNDTKPKVPQPNCCDSNWLCRVLEGNLTNEERKCLLQVFKWVGITMFLIAGLYSFMNPRYSSKREIVRYLFVITSIGFLISLPFKARSSMKKQSEVINDLKGEIKILNFKIEQQNELFLKEISRLQRLVNERTSTELSKKALIPF